MSASADGVGSPPDASPADPAPPAAERRVVSSAVRIDGEPVSAPPRRARGPRTQSPRAKATTGTAPLPTPRASAGPDAAVAVEVEESTAVFNPEFATAPDEPGNTASSGDDHGPAPVGLLELPPADVPVEARPDDAPAGKIPPVLRPRRAPLARLRERVMVGEPAPTPARAASTRRFRQTVRKVDLWSVLKLSLCFYVSAMFVMIVALVALWLVADQVGVLHSVEKFLGDLLEGDVHFLSASVLRGTVLVGVAIVLLQVVATVIAASFYNIFAELFGGLEITIEEQEEALY